jgi:hypothetical protein
MVALPPLKIIIRCDEDFFDLHLLITIWYFQAFINMHDDDKHM